MFSGTMETVARGKCLYRQGGAARSIYFLLEGSVQLVYEADVRTPRLHRRYQEPDAAAAAADGERELSVG